jgi:hypothetical protein
VHIHAPQLCRGCGSDLTGAAVVGEECRQVFDLPRIALRAIEHRAQRRVCGCGTVTAGAFPVEATAATCYGPGVAALGAYLLARQHLPVQRAAECLADCFGAPVSTGYLAGLLPGAARPGPHRAGRRGGGALRRDRWTGRCQVVVDPRDVHRSVHAVSPRRAAGEDGDGRRRGVARLHRDRGARRAHRLPTLRASQPRPVQCAPPARTRRDRGTDRAGLAGRSRRPAGGRARRGRTSQSQRADRAARAAARGGAPPLQHPRHRGSAAQPAAAADR